MEEILYIYLAGCVAVVLLMQVKLFIFWFAAWITKGNVLAANLKKLKPPDDRRLISKAATYVGIVLVEALLSWINVFIIIFQTLKMLLNVLRESLTETPESIKSLRFPLKNNPNMSSEAVWAHLQALTVESGVAKPSERDLLDSLREIREYYPYPDFVSSEAVSNLQDLNVLNDEVLKRTFEVVQNWEKTDSHSSEYWLIDEDENSEPKEIEVGELNDEENDAYAKDAERVLTLCKIAECHLENLSDEYEFNKLNERIDRAVEMAKAIPDDFYSLTALGFVAKLAHDAGLLERKEQILSDIHDPEVLDMVQSTLGH